MSQLRGCQMSMNLSRKAIVDGKISLGQTVVYLISA